MTELKSDALKAVNFVEAEAGQTLRGNPAKSREALRLSETRLAIYCIVSAVVGFALLRLFTEDEVVLVWGTLDLAVIGMWVWAYISKYRLLAASLKQAQSNEP